MRTFLMMLCLGSLFTGLPAVAQDKKSEPAKKDEANKDEAKKDEAKKVEPGNLLKPTNKVDSWRFEEAEGGKGKASVNEEWIAFKVTDITGTDWHVQAIQPDLDLKENAEYKLTFEIKSDVRRTAVVNAMIDEDDWHEIGLHEDLYVNTTPEKHETTFRATGVNTKKKNRITFALGTDKGIIYLKNVRLVEVKK